LQTNAGSTLNGEDWGPSGTSTDNEYEGEDGNNAD
jgi:hypothetical protein